MFTFLVNVLPPAMAGAALAGMDEREKMVHGIGYASWKAMSYLLESHGADEVASFKAFMVQHARTTAEEVSESLRPE